MVSNASTKDCNLSLFKKLSIERRVPIENIHPLSLIMLDVSSFATETNTKQNQTISIIAEILNDSTRKTDIKTFIHKSKFALFLPNTPESGARILSDRLYEEIKKVLNKNNARLQKNNYILFQISTYLKTSQGKDEHEVINKQYKKVIL